MHLSKLFLALKNAEQRVHWSMIEACLSEREDKFSSAKQSSLLLFLFKTLNTQVFLKAEIELSWEIQELVVQLVPF